MDGFVLVAVGAIGLLGGLGRGGAGGDLVSFLPTDTYFQSRRIPLNIENLEALARTEPKDGKAQILQLMALRALTEKPELIRKDSTAVLRTLEKIARGEIAKDRFGFSEEYARRALLALGSKITLPPAAQPADLCEEALGWFPASATLVGFCGGGLRTDAIGDYGNEVRKLLTKLVRRPRDWNEFFSIVEMMGNARIDRIGFAYATHGQQKGLDRVYVRITGNVDHQRMLGAVKTVFKNSLTLTWEETKDDRGTRITTAYVLFGGPAFALIGDTDLLLGGYVGGAVGGVEPSHLEVIQQLLAVRAGKEKSVLKGSLQDRLPTLSPETVGLLVGDLPEEGRREPFQQAKLPAPKSIRVDVRRAKNGMDVRIQATLANADEAKSFIESIVRLKQVGLDGLKSIHQETKDDTTLSRSAVASLRKALASLQLETDGAGVKGTLLAPPEALLVPLWLQLRSMGAVADLPPPPAGATGKKESRLLPALCSVG